MYKRQVLEDRVETYHPPVNESPYRHKTTLGAHLGVGIGYKNFNFDVLLKRNSDNVELSFGLKYQIAKRHRKDKDKEVKQGTILDETF